MSGNEVLYVRSSKKFNMTGEDTSTNDEDDVWDDKLLIEAYDKAVQLAHEEVLRNMQPSEKMKDTSKMKKKTKWNIGDKCRCEYSEDHKYYEADIIDIIEDVEMCIVKYIGYENEEKVPLHKLRASKGEVHRKLQIQQALEENSIKEELQAENESDPEIVSRSRRKKNGGKKAGKSKVKDNGFPVNETNLNSSDVLQYTTTGMTMPPPPPPHMFQNLNENVSESEAMSAMLMSWYMSGYHTGFYQGLKSARKK